ncbi:MAG: exonuclease domain-containing protein [Bowdeniella nasicola]|nr:exonuclease domain-containing protein [Bowdeniella nasicola]
MSWLDRPLVGFDTETTGVNIHADRIVSAAIIYDDGSGTYEEHTWLINPGIPIPQAAANVHGITTAIAQRDGRPPALALAEIAARLRDANRAGYPIVAFNAAFDLSLIQAELARHDLPALPTDFAPVIDPLVIDRGVEPYRRGKRRLADVATHYGVKIGDDLHRADVDVIATLQVLRAIAARHAQVGELTLAQLHAWQTESHREWARSFNEWRKSKHLSGPGASEHWPLEPPRG